MPRIPNAKRRPAVRHRATALAFVAGYVDTFSFLTLSGLFCAHVTGNFVILAATLVLGHPAGVWSKVLAVPMFAVGVCCASLLGDTLIRRGHAVWRPLLCAELFLLIAALIVGLTLGPFTDADHPSALLLAAFLILAMSTQSAIGQLATRDEPPSVVMTTTVTKLVVDVTALFVRSFPDAAEHEKTRDAAFRLAEQCAAFLLGCAVGASGHVFVGPWLLAVPALAIAVLLVSFDAP
jgi:uncharacterized membrane protein YoaK (UPF0700 family)